MLEFAEEALDQITLPVDGSIDRALDLAIALRGDVGLPTPLGDQIDQVLPVISTISNNDGYLRQSSQQQGCACLVRRLPGAQGQANRQTSFVNDGVDLAGQSSTRTANGVIRAPFLPPAACWWARTMEASINCIDCGEDAAKASKTLSQTPALAHRL